MTAIDSTHIPCVLDAPGFSVCQEKLFHYGITPQRSKTIQTFSLHALSRGTRVLALPSQTLLRSHLDGVEEALRSTGTRLLLCVDMSHSFFYRSLAPTVADYVSAEACQALKLPARMLLATHQSPSAIALLGLWPKLLQLRTSIFDSLISGFISPFGFRNSKTLALRSGISTRHADRLFRDVGLPSVLYIRNVGRLAFLRACTFECQLTTRQIHRFVDSNMLRSLDRWVASRGLPRLSRTMSLPELEFSAILQRLTAHHVTGG